MPWFGQKSNKREEAAYRAVAGEGLLPSDSLAKALEKVLAPGAVSEGRIAWFLKRYSAGGKVSLEAFVKIVAYVHQCEPAHDELADAWAEATSQRERSDSLEQQVATMTKELGGLRMSMSVTRSARTSVSKSVKQGEAYAATKETIAALEDHERIERHTFDKDRHYDKGATWINLRSNDFEVRGLGPGTERPCQRDAIIEASVGTGTYSNYEVDAGRSFLLLQQVNTAKRVGRDDYDPDPAVWGAAFLPAEFEKAAKEAVASGKTLLHRSEASADKAGATATAYVETHWLIENGAVTGARCFLLATQHATPASSTVRFKLSGDKFEMGSVETVEATAAAVDISNGESKVVVPVEGAEKIIETAVTISAAKRDAWLASFAPAVDATKVALPTESPAKVDYEGVNEEAAKLKLTLADVKGSVAEMRNDQNGDLLQTIISPEMHILNTADEDVQLVDVYGEWQTADKSWKRYEAGGGKKANLLGTPSRAWFGRQTFDVEPIKIEKKDVLSNVCLHTTELVNGARMYGDGPESDDLSRLVHMRLPSPLTTRITIVDGDGAKSTMCFDTVNKPINWYVDSYEQALATKPSGSGLGEDFKCELWLIADCPVTLKRYGIVITKHSSNAFHWHIRAERFLTAVPINSETFSPEELQRMAYQAIKDDKAEVPLKHRGADPDGPIRIHLLVDKDAQMAYGLRCEIELKHPKTGEVVNRAQKTILLDYTGITAKPKGYIEW